MTPDAFDTWILRLMGGAVVVLLVCVVWLAVDRRRRARALRDRIAGSGR